MAKVERDERGNIIDKISVVPAGAGEKWAKANKRREGFDAETAESQVTPENLEARDERSAA